MTSYRYIVTLFLFAATCPNTARADLILTLSSPDDLANLTVGSPTTVSLSLSGLEPSTTLTLLAGTVSFDGTHFDIPTISSGPIVPNPLADPLDFLSTGDVGTADAVFFTFSTSAAEHITQDGEFFSFTLVPIVAGEGTLSLSFWDAGAFDPSNPELPSPVVISAGTDLSYQISVVPELGSAVLTSSAVLLLLTFRRWNRRLR